jgi:hypothetical protein
MGTSRGDGLDWPTGRLTGGNHPLTWSTPLCPQCVI